MTLLITVLAAITCTVIWYLNAPEDVLKIKTLCFMFWGASIMWFVDAVVEYIELGAEYFTPAIGDMVNDLYLGVTVIALGLIIWLAILLIKDPRGVFKKMFAH